MSRTHVRFRFVLNAATLVMLGLSWPLWTHDSALPRVPFVSGFPESGAVGSWIGFAALTGSLALGGTSAWRLAFGLGSSIFLVLVLQDQHRFQPWVYQYMIAGLVLASLSVERGLRHARWWYVALYFHSGLSKLDVSFQREMGPLFLTTLARLFGVEPAGWPSAWRLAAILAMPAWEIITALLLCVPRSRRAGVVAALALHAALLGILGPGGLGHSAIVLVWNVATAAEVWVLFGTDSLEPASLPGGERWFSWGARAWFWIAVVLPFGERWGIVDAWPAHALYASHVERTAVYLHEGELESCPPSVLRHLASEGPGGWRRLDLTSWSRTERGVPVYPSCRACNGLAEGLSARYGGPRLVRVVQWGRADRWTGLRRSVECVGPESIRRQGDRYRLNAHPSRRSQDP